MFVICLLTLTFDSLNLKLANDRVQMHGALPLEAAARRSYVGGGGAAGAA